jgi:hypothetical protein
MSKLTIAAATAVLAASLSGGPAHAVPAANLTTASTAVSGVENVAWVCGRYRCWEQPGYYGYAPVAAAPRYVHPPYGYWRLAPDWYGYRYRRWRY